METEYSNSKRRSGWTRGAEHGGGILKYNTGLPETLVNAMPIDGKLLEILCCPVSKTPLTRLSPSRLNTLNRAIEAGEVQYVGGEAVTEALREGLVTEDSRVVYPVVDGIPILLADKGIGTTQLQDF